MKVAAQRAGSTSHVWGYVIVLLAALVFIDTLVGQNVLDSHHKLAMGVGGVGGDVVQGLPLGVPGRQVRIAVGESLPFGR